MIISATIRSIKQILLNRQELRKHPSMQRHRDGPPLAGYFYRESGPSRATPIHSQACGQPCPSQSRCSGQRGSQSGQNAERDPSHVKAGSPTQMSWNPKGGTWVDWPAHPGSVPRVPSLHWRWRAHRYTTADRPVIGRLRAYRKLSGICPLLAGSVYAGS